MELSVAAAFDFALRDFSGLAVGADEGFRSADRAPEGAAGGFALGAGAGAGRVAAFAAGLVAAGLVAAGALVGAGFFGAALPALTVAGREGESAALTLGAGDFAVEFVAAGLAGGDFGALAGLVPVSRLVPAIAYPQIEKLVPQPHDAVAFGFFT